MSTAPATLLRSFEKGLMGVQLLQVMQVACAEACTPGLVPTRNHDTSESQTLGSDSGAGLGADYV